MAGREVADRGRSWHPVMEGLEVAGLADLEPSMVLVLAGRDYQGLMTRRNRASDGDFEPGDDWMTTAASHPLNEHDRRGMTDRR